MHFTNLTHRYAFIYSILCITYSFTLLLELFQPSTPYAPYNSLFCTNETDDDPMVLSVPQMMQPTTNLGEFLCVGDYICLFSVETEGYTYSLQSRFASLVFGFWIMDRMLFTFINRVPLMHYGESVVYHLSLYI